VRLTSGAGTVSQRWTAPNASAASSIIDIRLPAAGTVIPSLDGIVVAGKFVYTLGGSNPNGIVIGGAAQDVITGIDPTTKAKALVGSIAQDGGCVYLGISVFEVVETNVNTGAEVNHYFVFGQLAVKVVRVYTSVGTN
jgi:hypothetical protein